MKNTEDFTEFLSTIKKENYFKSMEERLIKQKEEEICKGAASVK
jgi:hypothetical protein